MANTAHGNQSKGTCYWCVSVFKWIPVLFIMAVIFWSYYAYVVQLCINTVTSTHIKVICLIFYHLIFIMFYWSYVQTIFTHIGRVPDKYKLPEGEFELLMCAETEEMQRQILDNFAKHLPVHNRTTGGSIRYCDKCKHIKPDRAHHCSVCGECVLKMDHHCPWINNCVNFTNYKCFVLFLGYALLYCIYIALSSMKFFAEFWKGDLKGPARFHILFLFFVAVMFALSLVSLFIYHVYLVWNNRSTLEAFRSPIFRSGPDKYGYSLGPCQNFKQVFGNNPWLWFVPVCNSVGDGVQFPVQSRHQQSSYQSMENTQNNSVGDGLTFPQRNIAEDSEQLLNHNQHWDEDDS